MLGSSRYVLVLASLAALLALLALVAVAPGAEARELLESDDFTGRDGTGPNATMWEVVETHSDDHCQIRGNALRTHSSNNGYAYVRGRNHTEVNNLTMLVEWKMTVYQGRSIDIRMNSHDGTRYHRWIMIWFDADARTGGINYRYGGTERRISYPQDYVMGRWYAVNITVWTDVFNVTITERDTGRSFLSVSNKSCDPLGSDNYVHMGVFQYHNGRAAEAYHDDYRLYNISIPPNLPPVWGELPVMEAVEDVPFVHDFTNNVSDPDDPLGALAINSTSPYVKTITGLNVTFGFGEGVTRARVPLTLSDGDHEVPIMVSFVVQPVNDPPRHYIPEQLMAEEDVELSVDMSGYLWDVDNSTGDLYFLPLDDPYVSIRGQVMTALFPEGVLRYFITLVVTDGLEGVEAQVEFVITPVNDPPVLDLPADFTVVEDRPTVLNLTLYLSDVDTPLEELDIDISYGRAQLRGLEVHFLEGRGDDRFSMWVQVSDGNVYVRDQVTIVVTGVNDPPVIGDIPPLTVTEEEPTTLDLSGYVSDEETPQGELELTCLGDAGGGGSGAVRGVEGLNISLLYDRWVPQHRLSISVFDGMAMAHANVSVHVVPVNDPPHITMETAGRVETPEGSQLWLPIGAEDEDDEELLYLVNSTYSGFQVLPNGTLHISAGKGDVGNHSCNVSVTDQEGATDWVVLDLEVLNVNDPPTSLEMVLPLNGSVFTAGDNVTFEARASDPDTGFGQVLTFLWTSNLSGRLTEQRSSRESRFTLPLETAGLHRVEVSVSDGEFEERAWVQLTVQEPPEDGPGPPAFQVSAVTLGLLALVLTVVVVLALLAVYSSRRDGEEPPTGMEAEEEQVVAVVEGDAPEEGEPASAGEWVPEEEM